MAQATIQKIEKLDPIEGADKIERATVLGWGVVVKKDEFKPGDLCIFVEIDSVLPEGPAWSEFMKPRGFRVKTAKLRGCLSQGLVFPLDILPSGFDSTIGWDVSEVLGITHYEKPEAGGVIGGQSAGPFPPIPKTDETRLQSAPGILDELRGRSIYVTVKVDGTSGTFARMHTAFGSYRQGDFLVCTRNRSIKRPEHDSNAFWTVADRYDLANRLPEGFAIQGEVAGPKIQKNRLELKAPDLFVFNVFDMREGKYLEYPALLAFCDEHGLKTVPLVDTYSPRVNEAGWVADHQDQVLHPTQEAFLALAEGIYDGTKNRREGIVVRPLVELRDRKSVV